MGFGQIYSVWVFQPFGALNSRDCDHRSTGDENKGFVEPVQPRIVANTGEMALSSSISNADVFLHS